MSFHANLHANNFYRDLDVQFVNIYELITLFHGHLLQKICPYLCSLGCCIICQTCGAPLVENMVDQFQQALLEVNAIRENTQASTVKILNIMNNEKDYLIKLEKPKKPPQ
ncbi:hypothetical protein CEXT_9251 [Caerostris extrusa]|uniref:Uncharacterized protein n=1 Tax=Caerostris extrusa TaxID=172846 RepID=A0AAV4W8F7_CAEEX|nr:hypothetical protein CEXT_9251 [Caerostris extrusa]